MRNTHRPPRPAARHAEHELHRRRRTTILVTVAAVAVLCFVLARWIVPAGAAFPVVFP